VNTKILDQVFYNRYVNSIKNRIVISLTPLQQKVALVVLTIFSLFVLGSLFRDDFKRTKPKVKEANPQANRSQLGTLEDDAPLLNNPP